MEQHSISNISANFKTKFQKDVAHDPEKTFSKQKIFSRINQSVGLRVNSKKAHLSCTQLDRIALQAQLVEINPNLGGWGRI
jgi:hypothetical protein